MSQRRNGGRDAPAWSLPPLDEGMPAFLYTSRDETQRYDREAESCGA